MRDAQGRFLPGHDPARHPLSRKERRKGYRNALAATGEKGAHLYAWVWRKVRGYYRHR